MKKNFIRLITVLLILFLGIGIFKILNNKAKTQTKSIQASIPVVETIKIKTYNAPIIIDAHGTVIAQEIGSLTSEVSGKVIYISPKLRPGSVISKGELILKIDESDYILALENAKNNLLQAENQYRVIEATSKQAILAYKLEYGKDKKVPPLIAKEPDLKQALAQVKNAKVALKKAELDLKRTKIYAPYDLVVINKNVGIGDVVSPSRVIATYYDVNSIEIKVPIDPEKLSLLGYNSKAQVSLPGLNKVYDATFIRVGPEINPKTRLIDIYLSVKSQHLLPGQFVAVKLQGKGMKDLAKIPTTVLHDLNIVWVLDKENKIIFRKVKVIDEGENSVVVQGLKQGEEIVITPLGDVEPGLQVMVK